MNLQKLFAQMIALLFFIGAIQACAIIGYKTKPENAWEANVKPAAIQAKLSYALEPFGGLTFGGYDELKHIMAQNHIFATTERVKSDPKVGYFLNIQTRMKEPSMGSLVWGYIALSFLFLLPAYSGSSGFYVQYHLYKDGKELKMYEYEIRRKGFAWLPVLPFVWVNLITHSEEEAFEAVTNQFFQDTVRDKVLQATSETEPKHELVSQSPGV